MSVPPIQAKPPPDTSAAIAPYQVWCHLSAPQQHHICQMLITAVQQSLPQLENPSFLQEPPHDPHCPPS
ncbi:MAG: hypothetical protein F6K42_33300 [Leptolyngbya sp. SIO1D8]|nr:hypothetical protein [Leptolyngbya sp. SIO1D8]